MSRRLESESELGETGRTELKYCTAVKVTFKSSNYHVAEGAGIATIDYDPKVWNSFLAFPAANWPFFSQVQGDKGRSIGIVHKQSRSTALQNALAKVILIVVGGKKVTVEIDSTKLDPFYYDPIWEKYEVNVEDVDYDLDEEAIFDQIADEDLVL